MVKIIIAVEMERMLSMLDEYEAGTLFPKLQDGDVIIDCQIEGQYVTFCIGNEGEDDEIP